MSAERLTPFEEFFRGTRWHDPLHPQEGLADRNVAKSIWNAALDEALKHFGPADDNLAARRIERLKEK